MTFLSALFGSSTPNKPATNVFDIVTHAATLASNPRDIDPILDNMRTITASLKPNVQLTPAEQRELFNIYLSIEKYLIDSDPIRVFSKDELRKKMSPELHAELEAYESQLQGNNKQIKGKKSQN